jgi:endo-1,4-beta-xylanase
MSYVDFAGFSQVVTAEASTRVLDVTPPTFSLRLSTTQLSTPNHKLKTIQATLTYADECDPAPKVRLVSIVSNEPDDGLGDGDMSNDIQDAAVGTDDREFKVRAERSGLGGGRTYTVTYEVSDASGNTTVRSATVTVPR